MNLTEQIYQHVKDLPIELQQEVYDFVLFLKRRYLQQASTLVAEQSLEINQSLDASHADGL
jgi:hypothetical protein